MPYSAAYGNPLTRARRGLKHGPMKELQFMGGTVILEDRVADAIEDLAVGLAESGMSATIEIHPKGSAAAIQIDIGRDHVSGHRHVLHAKPATGEGSHLGLEDL